jgi:pyrimidine-specific ribonucleoside hydrolase
MELQMEKQNLNIFATSCVALILILLFPSCVPASQNPTPAASSTQVPLNTLTPEPTATATQTPFATYTPVPLRTQESAFPMAGTWIGNARNNNLEMQVKIVFQPICKVGVVCGTFELSLPCSGTFSLVSEKAGIYEFHAGDKSATCTGEGRDYLQLLPNGRVQYTSQGAYGKTFGELVSSITSASTPVITEKIMVFDDDDGSPDGTSALAYLLLKPNVVIKGASISYGEAHPPVYIQDIGRMLDNFGFPKIPLGVGIDSSLSGNEGFPEWLRQSAANFWGWPIPNPNKTYPTQTEADLIISVIKQSPVPVTLYFSGPVTNLALALRKAPEISNNIAALYMMGGAVYVPGNVHDFYPDSLNTYADWNPYSDPVAYKEVFASGLKMYLVPLDATNQVQISKIDTLEWRKGGKIAKFIADIYDGLMKSTGKDKFYIWDLMASEIMVNPALCQFTPLYLDVVTEATDHFGQLVVVPNKYPNINVCLKPDVAKIKQELIDTLSTSQ